MCNQMMNTFNGNGTHIIVRSKKKLANGYFYLLALYRRQCRFFHRNLFRCYLVPAAAEAALPEAAAPPVEEEAVFSLLLLEPVLDPLSLVLLSLVLESAPWFSSFFPLPLLAGRAPLP